MYNNNTNNTTNHQPVILPPGWMQATDPASGRIYYCNPTTKETRWDPPWAPIPAPSLPLPSQVPLQQVPVQQVPVQPAVLPLQPAVPAVPAPSSVAASIHSSSSTHRSSSGEGINDHSSSSSHHRSGLIVPVVRSLFDKVASLPDPALALDLELDGLTAGQIADLCHIQQADTHGSNQAYLPLNPYKMPVLAKRPEVEHARLDVRIVELKEKLQRYGGYKS